MRLRIELDGKDPSKNKFVDSVSGEPLDGIQYAEITIEPFSIGAYIFLNDFELVGKNIPTEISTVRQLKSFGNPNEA